MKRFSTLAACFVALVISGCIRDNASVPADTSGPIHFASSIYDRTRASGTAWDISDEIGIYMLSPGGTLGDGDLHSNVRYVTSGDGIFEASDPDDSDGALYYPAEGEVDFVAYYPYKSELDGTLYPIDISDQSDLAAIDLLFSDNAEGLGSGVPELDFYHKLVKLVFNVTDGEGTSLEGLTLTIGGMKTGGTFDLSDSSITLAGDSEDTVEAAVVSLEDADEAETAFEAIVLPDAAIDPVLTFTLDDGETVVATHTLENITYKSGFVYTYNITLIPSAEAVDFDGNGIHYWNTDPESGTGNLEIGKNPADNGGENSGKAIRYYFENFGEKSIVPQISISEFTGWSNGSVVYNNSGDAEVVLSGMKVSGILVNCMLFPAEATSDVTISSLPAGYSDIVFSCNLGALYEDCLNPLLVYADNMLMSPPQTIELSSEQWSEFSVEIPDGTTSIRLFSDSSENSIRIKDIALSGIPD